MRLKSGPGVCYAIRTAPGHAYCLSTIVCRLELILCGLLLLSEVTLWCYWQATESRFTACGFESWLGTTASVTNQYNLVPAKGQ